jgi:predicted acyltransferase
MANDQLLRSPSATDRIASIDVFRGLTMLLMLFVNDIGDIDLGHILNAPWWLKHLPGDIDGMTLADAIMPCFLFIVGLAIPIALEGRIARGESWVKLGWHIVARSMALIFIGLCMVNSCHGVALDETAMGMSGAWWRIGMFLGVAVFWNRYPEAPGARKWLFAALRIAAAVLLVYLLAIYRAKQGDATLWLTSRWWGIIGIIGWAYLVSAFVWLACRNHGAAIMGAFGLSIALNIGLRSGMLGWWNALVDAAHGWLPSLQFGAFASMVLAGMAVATLFRSASQATTAGRRIAWTLAFGAGFAAAGLLLRPLWGIHKNDATPSWILCSMGIACAAYAFLYWLVDVKKIARWTTLIAPAGSNTLLMYMLPYVFYSVLAVLGVDYLQTHFCEGWAGVARSAVVAVSLVGATALLTRSGIRLKV